MFSIHSRALRVALFSGCLLCAAGCTNYPMGMTKSEWEALTPGQRARYEQLQAKENNDALHRRDVRQPRG